MTEISYEHITKGIIAAEEILRKGSCTPDRIAYIETARLVLNDVPPSELKENIAKRLSEASNTCRE